MTHNVHHHGNAHAYGDEAQLAELLELDGELIGTYLDEATAWVEKYAPPAPRTIIDIGAGTGSGSIALARRFDRAGIIAVDNSAAMLDRLGVAVGEQQLTHRVRGVQADLDEHWPDLGAADIVWAASSLHHITDPDRALRDAYLALNPGGVLVVTEIDGLPQFLPDDVGRGRPGMESRCHEALAHLNWNAHPDWQPHLERAGFSIAERHTFTVTAKSANIARYAQAYLSRVRTALESHLPADDRNVLDHLLSSGHDESILQRSDLTYRGDRTAWAACRPFTTPLEQGDHL